MYYNVSEAICGFLFGIRLVLAAGAAVSATVCTNAYVKIGLTKVSTNT